MKACPTLTLAIALTAIAAARAEADRPVFAVAIDADSAAITETYRTLGDVHLALGATRDEVLYTLGKPNFKLTPNGWVYHPIHANRSGASKDQYRALVVVFNDHGVISYRLVNDRILAELEKDAHFTRPASPAAIALTAP